MLGPVLADVNDFSIARNRLLADLIARVKTPGERIPGTLQSPSTILQASEDTQAPLLKIISADGDRFTVGETTLRNRRPVLLHA